MSASHNSSRRSSLNPNAAPFTVENPVESNQQFHPSQSLQSPGCTLEQLLAPVARIEYVTLPIIHYEPYNAAMYNYYTQPYNYNYMATPAGSNFNFAVTENNNNHNTQQSELFHSPVNPNVGNPNVGNPNIHSPITNPSHPMTVPAKTRRLNSTNDSKKPLWASRSRRPSNFFEAKQFEMSQSLPTTPSPSIAQSQSSSLPASRYYQRRSSYDSQAVARYVARTAPSNRTRYTREFLISLKNCRNLSVQIPSNLPAILRADGIELKENGRSLFTRANSSEERIKTPRTVTISLPTTPSTSNSNISLSSLLPSPSPFPLSLSSSSSLLSPSIGTSVRPSLRVQLTPAAEMKKNMTSILNRLAPDKADRLVLQAASLDIDNGELLAVIINTIFDKSINEPSFAAMYAEFLFELIPHLPQFQTINQENEENQIINANLILLKKASEAIEHDHERPSASPSPSPSPPSDNQSQSQSLSHSQSMELLNNKVSNENDSAANVARLGSRRRAVLSMIGELFKHDLISHSIIHSALDSLTLRRSVNEIDDSEIEILTALLLIAGAKLDKREGSEENEIINETNLINDNVNVKVTNHFNYLTSLLTRSSPLSARLRFKILDLVELRSNNWQSKRKKSINTEKLKQIEAEFNKAQEKEKSKTAKTEKKHPNSTPMSPATQLKWAKVNNDGNNNSSTRTRSSSSGSSSASARSKKESVRFSDSLSYHKLTEENEKSEAGKEQETTTNNNFSSSSTTSPPTKTKNPHIKGILKNASRSLTNSPTVKWRRKEPIIPTLSPSITSTPVSTKEFLPYSSSLNRHRPSPLKPRLNRENLKTLTREIVDEFFVSRDLDEACLCLQELNEKAANEGLINIEDEPLQSPIFGILKSPTLSPSTLSQSAAITINEIIYDSHQPSHVIVLMTIIYSINHPNVLDHLNRSSSLTIASTLLRGFVSRKSLTHIQLISGWKGCFERLEDLQVDCPKAVNYISELLASAILDHCINIKQVIQLIKETKHQSLNITPFQFMLTVFQSMRDTLEKQQQTRASNKSKDTNAANSFIDFHQHDAFILAFKLAKGMTAIDDLIQLYQISQKNNDNNSDDHQYKLNEAEKKMIPDEKEIHPTIATEEKIDTLITNINNNNSITANGNNSINIVNNNNNSRNYLIDDSGRASLISEISSSLNNFGLDCLNPFINSANFFQWKL